MLRRLQSIITHVLNIACFFTIFVLFLKLTGFFDQHSESKPNIDEDENSFSFGFILLTCLKLFGLAGLPISLCNLSGFMLYTISPDSNYLYRHQPKRSPLLDPYFCIRIVTRGNYPELVRANVEHNMAVCLDYGLDRFIIEVVTDRDIGLPKSPKVREIVVPNDYRTKQETLFKARALQYAIEFDRDFISDEDWIVHLDEETALTSSSLTGVVFLLIMFSCHLSNNFNIYHKKGILNFMYEDKHQIGQGLITYGKERIYNWVITLADSVRVGSDLGALRFALKHFNRPLFSFKGSLS